MTMPHSHTCLKYHIVFSTKHRLPWITADHESGLYRYICGIIRNKNGQLIEIGGIEDHTHLLAGFHQSRTVAGMVGAIKSNSSSFGKEITGNSAFGWQAGYAAFTVSESQVQRVRIYIQRQKEHHRTMSYKDEIRRLCLSHGLKLDESYFEDVHGVTRARRAAEGSPGCQPWVEPGGRQRIAQGVNPGLSPEGDRR